MTGSNGGCRLWQSPLQRNPLQRSPLRRSPRQSLLRPWWLPRGPSLQRSPGIMLGLGSDLAKPSLQGQSSLARAGSQRAKYTTFAENYVTAKHPTGEVKTWRRAWTSQGRHLDILKKSSSGYIVFGDVNDCQRKRNPGHAIYKRIRKYYDVLRHLFIKEEEAYCSVVSTGSHGSSVCNSSRNS